MTKKDPASWLRPTAKSQWGSELVHRLDLHLQPGRRNGVCRGLKELRHITRVANEIRVFSLAVLFVSRRAWDLYDSR